MKNSVTRISRQTFLAGGLLGLTAVARGQERSLTADVDKIFAAWDKPDTPGCSLAVVQGGKVVYQRGYGKASLEYGAPNTPGTIFHVASVSKQFTAFAIQLLAHEGKLALDDDVRKYLPELNDFGKTITIRHLLHHTSGLRDQWNLLILAGWRMEDVITEDDILKLIWRQKELNFVPGAEELYSNTGYTLLGLIVKHVSGKPLPVFAQERIFGPLGMSHTHFHDDHRLLVKGRADSYAKSGDRYQKRILSYANVGATSLFTTVEDLARWDQNFYEPKVGDKTVLAAMYQRGKLNDGREITYASALDLGEYRGLKFVEHNGADAGFRSDLIRFPEQRFSVILLGNTAELNTSALVRKVADVYLADRLKPLAEPAKPKESVSPLVLPGQLPLKPLPLEAYAGEYYSDELHVLYTLSVWEGSLYLKHPRGEYKLSSTQANLFGSGLGQLAFQPEENDAPPRVFRISSGRVRNLKFVRVELK